MTMDAKTTFKRAVKSVRNLYIDPLPRNSVLRIVEAVVTGSGVEITYCADSRNYTCSVRLPSVLAEKLANSNRSDLAPTFAALAVALAPFFFKLSDFAEVRLEFARLDEDSNSFFARFLERGLAEFRYLQGLNPIRKVRFTSTGSDTITPRRLGVTERALMLNGGGKDSIVAGELLSRARIPFSWVTINSNEVRRAVVTTSGNGDSIEIDCEIDTAIAANAAYAWGHFPHTSMVLCIGLLVAQLTESAYVCVGNEFSANVGNVSFRGVELNHQYSKSAEFELGFSRFVNRCVSPDIKVFSILRPFHDLQLAKIFAHFVDYHPVFVSCNRGIAKGKWCKACAKCAFTALALAPFVGTEGLERIFGEDVLLRKEIQQAILELVKDGHKPWECVGTTEENRLALRLLLDRYPERAAAQTPMWQALQQQIKGLNTGELRSRLLERTASEHQLPEPLRLALNSALAALHEPTIDMPDQPAISMPEASAVA